MGRAVFRELAARGPVSLFPLGGPPRAESPEEHGLLSAALARAAEYEVDAPSLRIWHEFDCSLYPGRGRRGLYTFFETDRIPAARVGPLNRLDFVATATEWGAAVLRRSGVTVPVHVVRCGVDVGVFHPSVHPAPVPRRSPSTFVVLVAGKCSHQKGTLEAVRAFCRAFGPNDDVLLLLHVENHVQAPGYDGPAKTRDVEDFAVDTDLGRAGLVTFVGRLDSRDEVASLYQAADVGLSLSRAEGWNLPVTEMLGMGKPVVLLGNGAHVEYADEAGATVVPVTGSEAAYEPPFFDGSAEWAVLGEAEVEAAATELRRLYEERPGLNRRGVEFARRHPWARCANALAGYLGL